MQSVECEEMVGMGGWQNEKCIRMDPKYLSAHINISKVITPLLSLINLA